MCLLRLLIPMKMKSAIYKPNRYIGTTSDVVIRGLNFKPEGEDGWTLPVIAFPFNNALVFNAEMDSNALVGNRSDDGPNEATRFDYPEKVYRPKRKI